MISYSAASANDDDPFTPHTKTGPGMMSRPRGGVAFVRGSWLGTGLGIRARGGSMVEVLHGHPLKVRARVAEALAGACEPCHPT